jgi:hypothetical protein
MLAFCWPRWNMRENLMWRLIAKKLHIIACELQCIYDIVYSIGCLFTTIATCLSTLKAI